MANSNTECKKILRALPLDPEPTIDQMIEACAKVTSTEHTITIAVSKGVAEALVASSKEEQRCFNCGKFGHFIKDCQEHQVAKDFHQPVGCPLLDCPTCQHHHQHYLGNSQQSTVWTRATTSNAKPPRPALPSVMRL